MTIPEMTTITYGDKVVEYIYGEDALNAKTLRPIQRGERIYGRLLYQFPSIPQSDLESVVTEYELQFTDAWGKSYSAKYVG